jgi:hypothetical protein
MSGVTVLPDDIRPSDLEVPAQLLPLVYDGLRRLTYKEFPAAGPSDRQPRRESEAGAIGRQQERQPS